MVREGRLAANLGVRALARKVGCSAPTIVKLEHGQSIPSSTLLKRIAENIKRPASTLEKAATEFKAAKKSRAMIVGRPLTLASNLSDLPLVEETLASIAMIAGRRGKTVTESLALIAHLAAANGGLEALQNKVMTELQGRLC
jgi:transcriptional regulator with XRE-family HTH domain